MLGTSEAESVVDGSATVSLTLVTSGQALSMMNRHSLRNLKVRKHRIRSQLKKISAPIMMIMLYRNRNTISFLKEFEYMNRFSYVWRLHVIATPA
jgi:hypothetical protein